MLPTPDKKRRKRTRPFASLRRLAALVPPGRTAVTLVCLTLAGAAEGLGVASLLPLVAVIDQDPAQAKGSSAQALAFIASFGVQPTVGFFLVLLMVGMALKAALTLLAMRQVGRAVADVATRMRLDLVDALLGARWSYYVRQPVGRFSAALSSEASQAGEAYSASAQLASDLIQVVVYVAVVAFFSWQLGLLSLAVGLLMVLTLNRFVTIARLTARKQNRHVKIMVGGLTDLLTGIKPMKAMGRHGRFQALFRKDAEIIRRAQRRQHFARHANKALQEPILAICLAVGVYFALIVWEAPPGEVLVTALLLARTVTTIGKAQQGLQQVRIAETGFAAVQETIDLARRMREPNREGAPPRFARAVAFRDVAFAFGDTPVIADASFEVAKGRVTTITGTSGAGKTTLVDILLGLHEPTAGAVLVDDAPLASLDLIAWRRMTGYVPQELMLFHDTLLANVTLGQPEFGPNDVARALEAAGAADFVAKLPEGVNTVVGERGTRLSGGQRQRIAIARALIHRPALLILDEATTALDPETEANIVRNVAALAKATDLTVLAISHQPAWARAADRVIHLADGQVVRIDGRAGDGPNGLSTRPPAAEPARAAVDGTRPSGASPAPLETFRGA